MSDPKQRAGDVELPFDPGEMAMDARLIFIGKVRSPWKTPDDCPKNLVEARERGLEAALEVDEAWRAGLLGLTDVSHVIVLYWMNAARRDVIVQKPAHRKKPAGVFALRTPARPNPIAVATVRLINIDQASGRVAIDAIDCMDGTPLVDLRPWLGTIDPALAAPAHP